MEAKHVPVETGDGSVDRKVRTVMMVNPLKQRAQTKDPASLQCSYTRIRVEFPRLLGQAIMISQHRHGVSLTIAE